MKKGDRPLGALMAAAALALLILAAALVPAQVRAQADNPAAYTVENMEHRYAINLLSSVDPVEPSAVARIEVFKGHRLYVTEFDKEGTTWYRLRLGFFPTKEEAEKTLASIGKEFPEAWVTLVSEDERAASGKLAIDVAEKTPPVRTADTAATPSTAPPAAPSVTEEDLSALMDEAAQAMTEGDYSRAVQFYTKVLGYPDHKFRKDALELMGLARERKEQFAHARAIYREYLELYPEGEGAERVSQRLAGLETARAEPKEKLPEAKKRVEETRTDVYGTFSQFYNRDESYTDQGGNVVNRSSLSTDLDLNIRRRGPDWDLSAVGIGGYEYDFLNAGEESEGRLSRLYLDVFSKRLYTSARVGRQWSSTGGVLGRFDGGLLSFSRIPRIKVNLVSGFPVDSTVLEKIDTDRYFYGINADLGTFAESWDFNVFAINQLADGITDRRAVGGEARYFRPNLSFFSLVDYDISYGKLNIALFTGNVFFANKGSINFSGDYRKSPTLTTTNAIQGQGVETVSELLETMTEDEVRALAEDRTAESWSATLGGSYPINEKFQISSDFNVSEFMSTEASGGVEATPGTGPEYFYSLQLIGSSLIKEGDVAILGLRYSDTSSSRTISGNINTRYPVTMNFRVNPRFRTDYSESKDDGGDQFTIRPSLRMDYYWRRKVRLEFEGGVEWTYDRVGGQTDLTRDYFVIAGYRIIF